MRLSSVRVIDRAELQPPDIDARSVVAPELIGAQLEAIRSTLMAFTERLRPALPTQLKAYIEDTTGLLSRLSCRIAVIGQVKAGKSTFINAFVGRPGLLPAHVSPWTTAVTHLHFGTASAPLNTAARFTFFDAGEWTKLVVGAGRIRDLTAQFVPGFEVDLLQHHVNALRRRSELRLGAELQDMLGTTREFAKLDPELLSEYVCAGDYDSITVGKYSDIVKNADLFFPQSTFSFPTTVIDTPGTNDPFLVRDEITRQALDAADMYIVVLTARQALSSADVALLRILHGLNKERILIFINRIDELTNVAEDTKEIIDDVRQRLNKEVPGSHLNIFAGSALWAQMARAEQPIDLGREASRNLLTYAAHLGVTTLPASADGQPQALGAQTALMRCSGLEDLNHAVSEMMLHSHAGHVMSQVAATLRELAQIGPPILLQEITDLEAENLGGDEMVEDVEAECRSIEADVRDSEQTLVAVRSLQGDMQTRTSHVVEARGDMMHECLTELIDDFAQRECASLAIDVADLAGQRIWTSRPSDLRRQLETTFVKQLRISEEQLNDLETQTTGRLQSIIAKLNINVTYDEPMRPAPDVRPLPLGALRRVIALDLGDPWWKRWWSGSRSNAERVSELDRVIHGEFEPIVDEMADAAHARLMGRRVAILNRLTMLSLSLVEAFQDLSQRRLQRLRELADAGDESKLNQKRCARAARIDELKSHIETMRYVVGELEGGALFPSMQRT